jgi:RNA polymerase sigma-70 factor (ECF subfamily)
MTPDRKKLLNELIAKEWPKLRRFFRTKVPDADVLDLTQQTLLAFVEKRDVAANDRAYLWGIARRMVLKHYEKHRAADTFDSTIHTAVDMARSLSSRLDDRHRLLRGLHTLPVDHQMAFELRHGEELSLDEVAAALGVSLATAKRYIAAAEEKLRVVLSDPSSMRELYAEL